MDFTAKQIILFDLDGTITDPGPGITKGVQYSLASFGITVSDLTTLYPFIGPPLSRSFQDFYGFSPVQAEAAVQKYREYYTKTGIFENSPYPGIKTLLSGLGQAGKTVAVASSKPQVMARQVLEYFQLEHYFTFVGGSELNGDRTEKADVIRYVLNRLGDPSPDSCVMVGDRKFDVAGAKALGLSSIGVLYGYGSKEELTSAGACCLAADCAQLGTILLKT